MPPAARSALVTLLQGLYSSRALRSWLRQAEYLEADIEEWARGVYAEESIHDRAVGELLYRGLVNQRLFEGLLRDHPGEAARVTAVATAWGISVVGHAERAAVAGGQAPALPPGSVAAPQATQTVINHGPVGQQFNIQGGAHTFNLGTPVTPRAAETTRMKILFLAANPSDTGRLALDKEIRGIRERLQMAELRDRFELVSAWAVRAGDLRQELLTHKPAIVHFAGHGTPEGLILEGQKGTRQRIPSPALASLFGLFTSHVQCVVLNACYSDDQAEAIAQQIPVVVGMKGPVVDRAGVLFADGLYQAIGHGRTIKDAVALGRAAYELEGITATAEPQIKTKAGVNAAAYVIRPPV